MFTRAKRAVDKVTHVRGYVEDTLNLHALATRIESGPPGKRLTVSRNFPASTASPAPPPGYEHSLITKQGKKSAPRPPEGFVPFETHRPYSPHDFLPSSRFPPSYRTHRPIEGPSKPLALREDIFHQLDLDPLHETLNCQLISSYTTQMGRIQRRGDTRLTWKNQRKIGKAIRRARAMGLIPAFSQWHDGMIRTK